jgi:hypothetical protein
VEAHIVDDEPSGFLSRWSRRKTDVLQGKAVDEPVIVVKPVLPELVEKPVQPVAEKVAEEPRALSLDDVKLLTKDSDFKPFMAQNVGSDVRNAAMKKLFADPHFNVMDGLDIYIDDYSKSDPIPEAMLRAMTSSKFLKLFDDEEDKDKQGEAAPRENANNATDQTVAQCPEDINPVDQDELPQINSSQPELLNNSVASQEHHDNPHLRLQPDHAAPAPEAGRGT